MRRANAAGFTLIEMAMVVLVAGLLVGFGMFTFGRYMDDLALKGALDHIMNVLMLTRDRSIATQTSQTMFFEAGHQGTDYRVEVGGAIRAGWTLPRGITYTWPSGTISSVTITPDGRCDASGLVVLQSPRGLQDTVSVMSSGLFLRY